MSLGIGPGAMIDSIRLELLIGRGGMGDIWQGVNVRDHSRVAVKILREEFLNSTQIRDRFRREAEITELLNNTQTLKVLKYALTPNRIPYIIMELLEGRDLQSQIDRLGPLEPTEALEVIIEVLKALGEAHQLGIVHRDVKPSNLFKLAKSEFAHIHVKLLDFGLATQHNHNQPELRDRSLVGTYFYMSPEQAERKAISAKTDLYAIGATLYALLTGHPPREPSAGDQSFDHFKQAAPKLRDKNPQIKAPNKLDLIIQRCLAISPDERPESADVLRRALEQILNSIKRTASHQDEFSLAPDSMYSSQSQWSLGAQAQKPNTDSPYAKTTSKPFTSSPVYQPGTSKHKGHLEDQPQTLTEFLQLRYLNLTQHWTRAITERPEQSRLQSHNLKRKVQEYLDIFIAVSAGLSFEEYHSFLDDLSQVSFTHPPLELVPMITLSLLRRVIVEELKEFKSLVSVQHTELWLKQVDQFIFSFRQQFVQWVDQKRQDETNNTLYRLFSLGSETPIFCTLAGIAINTHPQLRASLASEEKTGLTGRKIFEILGGFQPVSSLFQELRNLTDRGPSQPHQLQNETNEGRAQDIVVYPYVIGRNNQEKLLIIIDVISERSQTEFIPSFDEFESDYASPQALPWLMTAEVPALTPELLGEVGLPFEKKYLAQVEPELVFSSESAKNSSAPYDHSSKEMDSSAYPQEIKTSPSRQPVPKIKKSGVWDKYREEQVQEIKEERERRVSQFTPQVNAYRSPSQPLSQQPHSLSQQPHSLSQQPHPLSLRPHSLSQQPHYAQRRQSSDLSSIPFEHSFSLQADELEPAYLSHHQNSSPVMSYPPDTAAYHRSRSLSAAELNQQHYVEVNVEERIELDSSAPTNPPQEYVIAEDFSHRVQEPSPVEQQIPQEESVEQQIQDQSLNPRVPAHVPLAKPSNEQLSQIPPPPVFEPRNTEANLNVQSDYKAPSTTPTPDPNYAPATLNQRGPKQTASPIAQANQHLRSSIQRGQARIEPLQSQNNMRSPWLLNFALFLVFVICLILLREPIDRWMNHKPSAQKETVFAPRSETPFYDENQVKNLKANVGTNREIKRDSNADLKLPLKESKTESKAFDLKSSQSATPIFVTLKVNAEKATFIQNSNAQIICNGLAFCSVPVDEVILIKSVGFQDHYLTPPQLKTKIGSIWSIELDALTQ